MKTETHALPPPAQAYFTHLQIERGLSANTMSAYRRDIGRYLNFLAQQNRDLTESRPQDIREFLVTLTDPPIDQDTGEKPKPLSARTAARVIIAVRGLHKFLALEGLTPTDPAAGIKPPTHPESLPKALTVEQVQQLLAAMPEQSPRQLRDKALLEFLYSTGARITEVIDLDVDDLHLDPEPEQPAVVLVRGKGGKDRLVPIGSYAQKAIQAYLVRGRAALAAGGVGNPAVFLNARGGRLSRQSAWQILKDAAAAAELDVPVSPHTLRHCFATHLLQGGADVRVVQELLGHSSVTTTQVYTKVTPDKLQEVFRTSHPRALHSA
ncbi:site-specific tyrosine recombinase XerD [Micrococcoides hystricis]|uniref:Tyrosine recombinase XerD n=1 Tax=Micrococcoides hystricis TaxID=1572761 RepID=A0ABV6P6U9_9MICC